MCVYVDSLANKQDLSSSVSVDTVTQSLRVNDLIDKYHSMIRVVSNNHLPLIHVRSAAQRVGLIVIPGCLSVCLSVWMSVSTGRPAAPADGAAAA